MQNKDCKNCGKKLHRKTRPRGELEAIQQFTSRKFCDRECTKPYLAKVNKGKSYHNKGFQAGNKYGEVFGKATRFKKGHTSNHPRPSGKKHYNWKGGITNVNEKIRKSSEYKAWRTSIFIRDNYTCQSCGRIGGELSVDHIKPFSLYPELRFSDSNARVLCWSCHKKTPTFAGRVRNYVQSS